MSSLEKARGMGHFLEQQQTSIRLGGDGGGFNAMSQWAPPASLDDSLDW